MSRVFEALTKASRDREHQTESLPLDLAPVIQESNNPVDHGAEKNDWRMERNSQRNAVRTNLPKTVGAPKSWRERIEELFFGWDLRRYETHPIVVLEEESAISEQYKILREQLKRLRTEAGIRTIAITSPVKRDGKTTVSVNLAAAIALEYEEKVILVDADLRAPSVHRYFNYDGVHGLTEYLSSNAAGSVKSLVRDTHVNGLRYIPAGKPTRFASELLAKEKMRRLIEELHAEYPGHMLIIDSPPVLATPDPLVLSRQVDGVIMVIRARKTPKDYLAKALSAFSSDKILGIVLNGADLGLGSKYYYYYSSNGHG
ncbi:MAG TPA: CpsD/CapB family tyrosine-protein kinase [Acidobacteriota bacterium]|nr:CpsD/CapB family tyrosine-protein kinase [Acidobacteriota bacterium]